MAVLITGAAGFIGSTLTQRLLSLGMEVVAVDNFNDYYDPRFKRENVAPFLGKKGFILHEGDITDKRFVSFVFDKKKYGWVIHLAASVGVRNSLLHPAQYRKNNVEGTRNVLGEAVERNVLQVIYASSSSVYGNDSHIPFREDQVVDSRLNPYAQSKKEAESLCRDYHQRYGIPITIFRFFTVYGPKGRPDMSPYIFTDAILKGKKITVFGDGSAKRDFTYVDDIVDGVVRGMEKPLPFEIFNLGASSPVDLISFIRMIKRLTGKHAKLSYAPAVPSEMRHTYADITKAKLMLGYSTKVKLEEGFVTFIDWFNKNRT